MQIIGLCGNKGSGKDTFANYLVKTEGYIKVAFADYIREALKILFDWNEDNFTQELKEKNDEYWKVSPRKMMQELGTEFLRFHCANLMSQDFNLPNGDSYSSSFHIKRLNKDINKFFKDNNDVKIIISDIRFQDEVDYVKKIGGTVIKINRELEKNNFSTHASEIHIDNLKSIDINLMNDQNLSHYIKKIRFTVEHIQDLISK